MSEVESEGPGRGELVPVGPDSMREWAEQLVATAREDGVALTGEGGLLTEMMRHVLQTGLEVEMAEHLGYEPHERGRSAGNARNGAYDKTVTTEIGEVELRMPRDRQGTFKPVTVPKYQRRLDGLSGNVISLYAKGLTTGDIQQHLLEIYGTEVSRETISKITDQIVGEMVAWQSRPLDPLYAVLLDDAEIDAPRTKVWPALTASQRSRLRVPGAPPSCGVPGRVLRLLGGDDRVLCARFREPFRDRFHCCQRRLLLCQVL